MLSIFLVYLYVFIIRLANYTKYNKEKYIYISLDDNLYKFLAKY